MISLRYHSSNKGRSKAARLITFSTLILLITIGMLELALRAIDPIGIAYFSEAKRYFSAMQKNDAYAYIHRPGYADVLQNVEVVINTHGLRGPEFTVGKPEETTRVLILGDSVVFGWGAPQDSLFPMSLQKKFDEWPQRIEVIPAGVGSWNTRTEYEYFRNVALKFDPDILVLVIVENDLEPKSGGHTEISRKLLINQNKHDESKNLLQRALSHSTWLFAVERSYVCKYIQYFAKLNAVRVSQKDATPHSAQWQDAKLALDGIVSLCRKKNIDLVVCLYGTPKRTEGNPVLNLYREHLEGIAVKAFSILPEEFSEQQYRNSRVDGHANADGHELIGGILYALLEPVVRSRLHNFERDMVSEEPGNRMENSNFQKPR